MQVRSAMGAIQRDAAAAVDARFIPNDLKSAVKGASQKLNGFPLQFYTLTGAGFDDGVPLRALRYITYSSSGERKETILTGKDGATTEKKSNIKDFLLQNNSQNNLSTTLSFGQAEFGGLPSDGLPLFFTMEVTVSYSGGGRDIGAASAGPDKTWNTKDDIRTWVEK